MRSMNSANIVRPGRWVRRGSALLLANVSLAAIGTAQAQTAAPQPPRPGTIAPATAAPSAQSQSVQAPPETIGQTTVDSSSNLEEEILVTGVGAATGARKANVSYSVLTEDDMSKFTPISADDMLRDMPGVVVESNDGVARNEVFTRGMTIGTGSNTSGYFWTTILEDGLPVTPFKFSGFQDGYFYRADIATSRVESVRGGSSATGISTSVGATFNYITGMPRDGLSVQARVGFEGEDLHLSWRQIDGAYGWTNRNKDFGLGVSGFYRTSNGQVNPGYNLNRGGQFRVNMRKDYVTDNGSGGLNIVFKHLDDTNAELTTFQQPAYGYQSPEAIEGFPRDVNLFMNGGKQEVPNYFRDGTHTLTPQEGYRYRQDALSLAWNHVLDNGLAFKVALRYNDSRVRGQQYKTNGVQSLGSAAATRERLGLNVNNLDRTPGFYEFYDDSNTLVARVANNVAGSQLGTNYRTGAACPRVTATTWQTNSLCVTANTLPNRDIDLRGGTVTATIPNADGSFSSGVVPTANASRDLVLLTGAEDTYRRSRDFIGNFAVSYTDDPVVVNFAIYTARSTQNNENWANGRGISTWADGQVRNLNARYVTATGTTYQLTDPGGWAAYGTGSFGTVMQRATIFELSPYGSVNVSPNEHWDFNASFKYSYFSAETYSESWNTRNPNAASLSFGGLDGDPLTVYDNLYNVQNLSQTIRAQRDVGIFNYSAAIGYNFNRNHKLYIRYTDAKNPSAGVINRYSTPATLVRPLGPTAFIKGFEAAYTFQLPRINGQITYFRQKFAVNDYPFAIDTDNVSTYLLPENFNRYISEGVEAWARVRIVRNLEWTPSVTWLNGRNIASYTWLNTGANGLGAADDVLRIDAGILARTPKWTINNTLSYQLGDFRFNLRHRWMDERKLNNNTLDTRYLPTQDNLDLSVQFAGIKNTRVTFDVRNVLDTQYISAYDTMLNANLPPNVQLYDVIDQLPDSAFLLKRNAPRSMWLTVRHDF